MAELFDEETLLGDSNAKSIEVFPEMLDFEFVDSCTSVDELRAVLKSLISGEHGKYPQLENTVRAKLLQLLPEKEKRKIHAISAKPSISEVAVEREGLQGWLGDLTNFNRDVSTETGKEDGFPVRRGATHTNLTKNKMSTSPTRNTNAETLVFRKEKLSTKEYFDRWDKYDVDAALESSDDEAEVEQNKHQKEAAEEEEKEEARKRREHELSQLKERLAELTQAEGKFMSVREMEKGNENFKAGEIEEAISCYSKSILLDEFNVKALAQRTMCFHKSGRFEDAVVGFEACHEMDGNAGYDRLSKRSKEKLQEQSLQFYKMVIEDVDGLPDTNDADAVVEESESEDEVEEEVYTLGALEAEKQDISRFSKDSSVSDKGKAVASKGAAGLAGSSKKMQTHGIDIPSSAKLSDSWHKISIVETSDSDEDVAEEATTVMRKIVIVEESESEDEDEDTATSRINISQSQRDDSDKLKAEGNGAMKQQIYADAVRFYTLALEANPENTAALNNRSIAYIKMEQWQTAIVDATSCLAKEPSNTKALYRRGVAKMMQDESNIKEALDDFQLALSFDSPKDQRAVLLKKVTQCQTILSSKKEFEELDAKSKCAGKKKVHHDTQALNF